MDMNKSLRERKAAKRENNRGKETLVNEG